jgi:uncharacterized lipoprotein YmbA
MMNQSSVRPLTFVLAGLILALSGCGQTQPSNFYLLSVLPAPEAPIGSTPASQLALGVGPVSLPSYLDRPQLVTRASPNRLAFAEFDRWAESLKDMFPRTLAENLSALLGTDRVFVVPRRSAPRLDYQVAVEVLRFDMGTDGQAVLSARWTIFGEDGKEALLLRKSVLTEQVTLAGDPEGMVVAMSRAIEALSREIARAIQSAAG